MRVNERALKIFGLLNKNYADANVALGYSNSMQLLAAVILSAQCTDKRVNIVTAKLFKKYKSVNDFANADINIFEQEIKSTGFYRNKSKNILGAAKMIIQDFNSRLPDNMQDLLKLPGVARKTANVVLSEVYNKNEGVCVDTHVGRLSQRWRLTKHKNPVKIEQDIMKLVPQKYWERYSLMTIQHGRQVCYARKPNCDGCFLNKICPSAFRV